MVMVVFGEKKSKLKFGILSTFVLSVLWLIFQFDLIAILSPSNIENIVVSMGRWAPIAFIVVYILMTILMLPVTPASLAAGILFGPYWGILYILIASSTAASGAFFFSRWLGEGYVSRLVKKRFKKLDAFEARLEENGFPAVLILRLLPVFPFGALNYALGLTRVNFRHYLPATMIGILPASFSYALFGDAIIRMNIVVIGVSVFLIGLLSVFYYYYRK